MNRYDSTCRVVAQWWLSPYEVDSTHIPFRPRLWGKGNINGHRILTFQLTATNDHSKCLFECSLCGTYVNMQIKWLGRSPMSKGHEKRGMLKILPPIHKVLIFKVILLSKALLMVACFRIEVILYLMLNHIVCVFDQAFYAKAAEIVWEH